MKIQPIALLFLTGVCLPLAARAQTVISTGYSSGTTLVYDAAGVSTSGTVAITGGANISLVADTHVTLNAGFKVAVGAQFRAKAGPDVDGDGMPNAWEATNSLDLLTDDAAGNPDSDGLPNHTEYQLGTNPHSSVGNSSDTGNTTALKIHKPN
jgi:hypothetical protein